MDNITTYTEQTPGENPIILKIDQSTEETAFDDTVFIDDDSYTDTETFDNNVLKLETDKIVEENITTDTTIDEEISSIIESFVSMNYIELTKFRTEINTQIENLTGAMNLLISLENMKDIDDINRRIAAENILQDKEYQEDSVRFKKTYPENLNKLNALKDAIDKELEKYNNVVKGTKFITDQMVDTLEKNIFKMNSSANPDSQTLKILYNTLRAYKDRTDISYIESKARLVYVVNKLKKELKNRESTCFDFTHKEFLKYFNQSQLTVFENYIINVFNGNESAANTFIYHLAKIMRSEKDTGYINNVKVIVLNVLDINSNIYDLNGGKEEFDKKLHNLYPFYN